MKYIVYSGKLNLRSGGPSGYIANLKEGILNYNISEFKVLSQSDISSDGSTNKNIKNFSKKIVDLISKYNSIVFEKIHEKKIYKYKKNVLDNILKLRNSENCSDDMIHFHTAIDFYNGYSKCKNMKTILTTHNPECLSSEYIDFLKSQLVNNKYDFQHLKMHIKEIQKFAYENADYLIFPSPHALEPYYETIEGFENIIKDKKIYYNMTGCNKLTYKLSKDEFREKYKIPPDKFIISYVGRHNEVKGYDLLIKASEILLEKHKDIVFVVAGKGNIETPKNKSWIDIGWTDDPGSLINASDIFILPNRKTYFDLILLEVLSLGKAVIASDTGGNKTVSMLTSGIKLFKPEDEKSLADSILHLYNRRELIDIMGRENLKTYNEHFTTEKFVERYIKTINLIENDQKSVEK